MIATPMTLLSRDGQAVALCESKHCRRCALFFDTDAVINRS